MADTKITALTEMTTPVDTDLVPVVDDPAGTPLTQKLTFANLWSWAATYSGTLTNKTISGASNTITNVSLTTGVTGTLPVGNGGTGSTSFTSGGVLIGAGAGALSTAGNVLAGSGYISIGASPSAAGSVRVENTGSVVFRNAADSADAYGVSYSGSDELFIGSDSSYTNQATTIRQYAGGTVYVGSASTTLAAFGQGATEAAFPQFVTMCAATGDYGGGSGVIFIGNAGGAPGSTPTGGGILSSQSGALHWKGSSGTDTTIAPADPHCPTCGRDFAIEHRNVDAEDHFAICVPCMVDAIKSAGIDVSKFTIHDDRKSTKSKWTEIREKAHGKANA